MPARLKKAQSIGAIPINFRNEDPLARILKDYPRGVNCSCDCVGFECVDDSLKPSEAVVINNCIAVTRPGGAISLTGVYLPSGGPTEGAPNATAKSSTVPFPVGDFWLKGLSASSGLAPIARLQPRLRDLIISGKAKPSFIVSSEIGIEKALDGYKRFSAHEETKVVIRMGEVENSPVANGSGEKVKRKRKASI